MPEAWIIGAVRTPRGRGKKETGALSGIHPQELLAGLLTLCIGGGAASEAKRSAQ